MQKNGNSVKARVLAYIVASPVAVTPEMILPGVDGAKLSTIRAACFDLLDGNEVAAVSVKPAGRLRPMAAFFVRGEQLEGLTCKPLKRRIRQFGWVAKLKAWWRKKRRDHASSQSE